MLPNRDWPSPSRTGNQGGKGEIRISRKDSARRIVGRRDHPKHSQVCPGCRTRSTMRLRSTLCRRYVRTQSMNSLEEARTKLNKNHERELIAQRTRDALQAAKARGTKLGNPKLAAARESAIEVNRAAAERYAVNFLPVIREIQARGITTLRGV